MILTKYIKTRCSTRNIKMLKENNKDVKIGDEITIHISNLSNGSNKKIEVKCDNCDNTKEITYYDYNKITSNKSKPYYCIKCKGISIKNTVREKYGVDNVFQLEETKSKTKETNIKKYGFDHHLKNKGILQKQINTNNSKYGVDFITKLNKPIHTNESFIKESSIVHNYFYDYSLSEYINGEFPVKIICPIHGIFKQSPKSHLNEHGCNLCNIDKLIKSRLDTKEDFIKKSNKAHNNFYDYSKVEYINCTTKVIITCPKHGDFRQRPQDHINSKNGCPLCKESKGEKEIRYYLELNNIKYIYQKKFEGCRYKNCLPFDVYLPDYNICIEFDGEQHFTVVEAWGGEEGLNQRKKKDKIKTDYCMEKGIKLIRIRYDENVEENLKKLYVYKINTRRI